MCASKSSCPLGLNSEKYGAAPQPTNQSPLGSGWKLPWLAEESGLGCSNWARSLAERECGSNASTIPRDWGCTLGTAPLSKMLIDPLGSVLASCWYAIPVRPLSLTVAWRPPSLCSTWPLRVLSTYNAHVLRAEISVVPSARGSTELMWKKSSGHFFEVPTAELCESDSATWSTLCHSRRTSAVRRSISWNTLSVTAPPLGPPRRERSQAMGAKMLSTAVPWGMMRNSCRSAL